MSSFDPDFARDIGDDVHNYRERQRVLDHRLETDGQFGYSDAPGGFVVPHTRGTLAELQTALGHWAEDAGPAEENFAGDGKFMKQWADASDDVKSSQLSSHHINNHYLHEGETGKLEKNRVFDVSSVEGRLQAVNNLSQVNANDPLSQETCAASSLVAAAMLNGGKSGSEGIEKLMAAMDHTRELHKDANLVEGSAAEDAIRKHIEEARESGAPLKLSEAEMHALQRDLYTEMHMVQTKTSGKQTRGMTNEGMQGFIDDNKEFHDMMVKSHMSVMSIDCNGNKDGRAPHAVLKIGDSHDNTSAVYDPWTRDAGQLVTDKKELFDYENAKLRDRDTNEIESEVQ